MKYLTILIFCVLSHFVSCQQYNYEFVIQGVNNVGEAKEITDPLREIFNTASEPYEFYPSFDEVSQSFVFGSDVLVQESELITMLSNHGYNLTSFSMTQGTQLKTEENDE